MRFDVQSELSRFLAEDVGDGDITGMLLQRRNVTARVIPRDDGILAGSRFAGMIFALVGCRSRYASRDGDGMVPDRPIMTVRGDVRGMLGAERTALNLLSRMSGIATQTHALASRLPPGVKLYATRKTAPGLRFFDKEAVRIGGGMRHRMSLDRAVMIKDNHLAAGPGIIEMLKAARKAHSSVEIEVENASDAVLAARGGASTIMLDNFTPGQARAAISKLERLGLRRKVRIEISGGITAKNIGRYADAGADMISSGSITNSVRGTDFSLEVERSR